MNTSGSARNSPAVIAFGDVGGDAPTGVTTRPERGSPEGHGLSRRASMPPNAPSIAIGQPYLLLSPHRLCLHLER
ncbi:MAG: hypothetical protein LC772_05445 [Chloroflexi bacterium]|nr:hypothetical protein [Chloroflexota bacterium]